MSITCAYESSFGQSFANMQQVPLSHSRAPTLHDTIFSQPMVPMALPTGVHVYVEGVPFQYQLTEEDLLKVFTRYGTVSNITILDDGGSAVVQYSLAGDAAKAQSFLDGKVLNGVQGSLRVTLFPSVPIGRPTYDRVIPTGNPMGPQKKYTCRFEIPPEIEKDFCVSKRIIGQKGANMKKIVTSLPCADLAKLRLRGRGSGFLEQPNNQECDEELHLCVSCKDAESYTFVVGEVTILLEGVYRQYADWCKERGIQRDNPTVILKEQSVEQPQPPVQAYSVEHFGPKSLYPPNWNAWQKPRTTSPMSFSTHAGNSGVPTPPDVVSPSGSRCALDVGTIERLIEERNEARRVCNFKEADRIRDLLRSHGIGLMDEPGARGKGREVTSWRFGSRK